MGSIVSGNICFAFLSAFDAQNALSERNVFDMKLSLLQRIKNFFSVSTDIGIDLGTASVLVHVKDRGIVLCEPSVVAIDKGTGKLYAVGAEAQKMLGRTPGNIVAVRPMREGVISDYSTTEMMLKYFIRKVCKNRMLKPRIMICVPSGITEVEERAVIDAAMQAGGRQVYLIEEPIAAAIGAGIDISRACGSMVVDIGGGTSDIAVISLGGIVVSSSIKVAGDKFDDAIVRYIRKKYNAVIGDRTGEELKKEIGSVYPIGPEKTMEVRGRSLLTGLPVSIVVSSEEIRDALDEVATQIVDVVHSVIERTPPELVGDIAESGIILTGGGSMIAGLDKLLIEKTGIHVYLADDPLSCVARGTGASLDNLHVLRDKTSYMYNLTDE